MLSLGLKFLSPHPWQSPSPSYSGLSPPSAFSWPPTGFLSSAFLELQFYSYLRDYVFKSLPPRFNCQLHWVFLVGFPLCSSSQHTCLLNSPCQFVWRWSPRVLQLNQRMTSATTQSRKVEASLIFFYAWYSCQILQLSEISPASPMLPSFSSCHLLPLASEPAVHTSGFHSVPIHPSPSKYPSHNLTLLFSHLNTFGSSPFAVWKINNTFIC